MKPVIIVGILAQRRDITGQKRGFLSGLSLCDCSKLTYSIEDFYNFRNVSWKIIKSLKNQRWKKSGRTLL